MLLPKSSCVCIPCNKSVAQRVCIVKVPFWPFFRPDIKTEMGVVICMHFKHSPDYIDSKYIWVRGSNSQGSSVFTEIQFLAFLPYTGKGRGVARWDLAHVTPRVKLYMRTKF